MCRLVRRSRMAPLPSHRPARPPSAGASSPAFVQQSLASPSLAGTERLQRALAGWVRDARAAGLSAGDLAALFDRAVRDAREGVA